MTDSSSAASSRLSDVGGRVNAYLMHKANIQDITDPLNPFTVDGNATLQLRMTDHGEPGSGDTLGIQVLNKNGGMWLSSNWKGTQTVEQTLLTHRATH